MKGKELTSSKLQESAKKRKRARKNLKKKDLSPVASEDWRVLESDSPLAPCFL